MTDYFTAHDVLKSRGAEFLSTLNKWANFIQKECDYQFHYDYIRFASHTRTKRTINHRKTRMFSLEEIQKFQKVIKLIPILGRNTSLRKLFDKKHHLDTMNHSELLTEIINQIEVKLANKEELFQALTKSTNNWKEAIKH